MAQPCPVCGGKLQEIKQGDLRGVRCEHVLCLFNFEDQQCPQCGEKVTEARRPNVGQYFTKCANGHEWSC
jgi:hypothetical protein